MVNGGKNSLPIADLQSQKVTDWILFNVQVLFWTSCCYGVCWLSRHHAERCDGGSHQFIKELEFWSLLLSMIITLCCSVFPAMGSQHLEIHHHCCLLPCGPGSGKSRQFIRFCCKPLGFPTYKRADFPLPGAHQRAWAKLQWRSSAMAFPKSVVCWCPVGWCPQHFGHDWLCWISGFVSRKNWWSDCDRWSRILVVDGMAPPRVVPT